MKKSRTALAAILALALAGCARDPTYLVEKTLNAREQAMAKLDAEAYAALFHPDYRFLPGETDTVIAKTIRRFGMHDSMKLKTYNRHITFQDNGDVATVVQEYDLATQREGKVFRVSDRERFLMKRYRTLLRTEYLFYQGLGM
jgi:hypothetical protein